MNQQNSTKRRGQVIEKSPGVFLVRIFVGRTAEGKRQYVSETVRGTREDAERALTAKLHDADTGRIVLTPRVAVREFLEQWLTAVRPTVEPRTALFYEQYARNHLVPALGSSPLSALSPIRVQGAWAALGRKGLGPRTVRHCHAVLRAALRWGVKMRLLGTVATDGVMLPKVSRSTEKRTLTPSEAKLVLETARTAGDTLYALWRVLLECGLRPAEARALRWDDLSDLNIDGRTYRTLRIERAVQVVQEKPRVEEVRNPKTDRSRRSVPLTEATVEALEAHRRAQAAEMLAAGPAYDRQGLIFAGRLGGLMAAETVLKRWRTALHRAGLPRMRVYDTRHTAATLMLEAGVPLKVVSELLGHSNIAITADTYQHVTASMAAAATDAMSRVLGRSATG